MMTFRSLYRLERRGLLNCPVLGVALDDWTVEHLRDHARAAIVGTGETIDEAVFARLAARLAYVRGDFGDSAPTLASRRPSDPRSARCSIWRSPHFCSQR